MNTYDRRGFLNRVGSGMLVSAVGLTVVSELNLLGDILARDGERLDFGELEPLVAMMQETSADNLMPALKERLEHGVDLGTLVTAAALANARTFGGEDYDGYHCFMAMVPALEMSRRLSGKEAALPVFKVLHRNARRIQAGGGKKDVLRPVRPDGMDDEKARSLLLSAGRSGNYDGAEKAFAALTKSGLKTGYAAIQPLVRDNIDVHQVVLAFRCWDMMRLTGEQNGGVLLRQVVRHCVQRDQSRRSKRRSAPSIRELLPKLMEAYQLDRSDQGSRNLSSKELIALGEFLFSAGRDEAAERIAGLLGEGVGRDDLGEAISLASTNLLLHDPGRAHAASGKPKGSVHGASIGVHAADSANAWRGIAAATDPVNANACLVTAAWHTAGQSGGFSTEESGRTADSLVPFHARARDEARTIPESKILPAIQEAVRGKDQAMAAALTERYGKLGKGASPLIALLLEPAILNDGALHHEKYFLTATEEFSRSRPECRWHHLVSLARVMASGAGYSAPGVGEAKRLLLS